MNPGTWYSMIRYSTQVARASYVRQGGYAVIKLRLYGD